MKKPVWLALGLVLLSWGLLLSVHLSQLTVKALIPMASLPEEPAAASGIVWVWLTAAVLSATCGVVAFLECLHRARGRPGNRISLKNI